MTSPAKLPWCQGATELFAWLQQSRKKSPWCQGTARDAAKMYPMLEDVENMANQTSRSKEAAKTILLLEDAKDKLEGYPRERGREI